jgi:hypothetical protein
MQSHVKIHLLKVVAADTTSLNPLKELYIIYLKIKTLNYIQLSF